jgi:hypothetical protein
MRVEISTDLEWLDIFSVEFPARLNVGDLIYLYDIVPPDVFEALTEQEKESLCISKTVKIVSWHSDLDGIYQYLEVK